MAPIPIPTLHNITDDPKSGGFSLDPVGVSGFFGGEEVISALATVHLETERRWLGWYNSPGSYNIGRTYGQLADSKFWRGLFPGRREEPEVVFKLDGSKGPRYVGAFSGTCIIDTGHLASLLMDKCKQESKELSAPGRQGSTSYLNVVSLVDVDHDDIRLRTPRLTIAFAILPIIVNLACCAMCALGGDWFCFAIILIGILAGGISNIVIGAGAVKVDYNKNPAKGSPPGDGLLIGSAEVTIIRGREMDTNIITKGRFRIDSANVYNRRLTGFCSFLLLLQFLAQLLLVPQGTFMGQVWFLTSLAASWAYTSFFPSKEHDDVQQKFLWKKLGDPHIHRFKFGSRTAMAVFAVLALEPTCPMEMVDELLSNKTTVWRIWRQILKTELSRLRDEESEKETESVDFDLEVAFHSLSDGDKTLLENLKHDLRTGIKVYEDFMGLGCCLNPPLPGLLPVNASAARSRHTLTSNSEQTLVH
ncbi:hypothetical protein CONPUDRAFT_168910 [Coniophora puteana RWD-64-598 SS2]|uniref:Uncharacterized protein n=1 Tax=Coniophora puteana (strain RWD-64-598) TaxID=741705 RepID=A0A5M3MAP5_CONPW|nr:uncharacterized protein CONPUDRAFT_168910 [Coniophora puteana RWD-64-598 SS2]EIW76352.1 hypothetical protein CONPUDRAFT_168910 [Coniophora puteana RWD-64-598 SS2]